LQAFFIHDRDHREALNKSPRKYHIDVRDSAASKREGKGKCYNDSWSSMRVMSDKYHRKQVRYAPSEQCTILAQKTNIFPASERAPGRSRRSSLVSVAEAMRLVSVWVRVLGVEQTLVRVLRLGRVIRRRVGRAARRLGELVLVVVVALRLKLIDVLADHRRNV
jgi:hypothetical protein